LDVPDAYALYRTRDEGPDSENAKFFRKKYAREVEIHFLGIWDTVGALGHLEQLGIVKELTARKRNRLFSYADYIGIMSRGTELPGR
jgi:uncharacterized protein (DUF2235 family)